MPKLTLETLPFDILEDIFATFDNFEDVQNLIAASPVCLRFFNTYEASVLSCIAKKLVCKDTWEATPTVLSYQRYYNCAAIGSCAEGDDADFGKPILQTPFSLRRSDISQFLANQRFYQSCSDDLPIFLYFNYPRSSDASGKDQAPSSSLPTPSFGNTLPVKLFYDVWLMSFRFEHESISSLAHSKPLSKQQYTDIQAVSRLMYKNNYSKEFGCSPKREWKQFCNIGRSGFFSFSSPWLSSAPGVEKNPALFMKLACRFVRVPNFSRWGFLTVVEFMKVYPGKGFDDLMEEWEFCRRKKLIGPPWDWEKAAWVKWV